MRIKSLSYNFNKIGACAGRRASTGACHKLTTCMNINIEKVVSKLKRLKICDVRPWAVGMWDMQIKEYFLKDSWVEISWITLITCDSSFHLNESLQQQFRTVEYHTDTDNYNSASFK